MSSRPLRLITVEDHEAARREVEAFGDTGIGEMLRWCLGGFPAELQRHLTDRDVEDCFTLVFHAVKDDADAEDYVEIRETVRGWLQRRAAGRLAPA